MFNLVLALSSVAEPGLEPKGAASFLLLKPEPHLNVSIF
jgi:hypothetical protein